MSKTNYGLIDYVETAFNDRWGYVYGTFGQVLTPTLFEQKKKQYPKLVEQNQVFIRDNWLHKRTADCVGLIKAYMWTKNDLITYDPKSDVSANGMYQRAKNKGYISSMPETVGLGVWRNGHIGVYIGNGYVIESRGTSSGIQKNRLKDRTFTHWLEIPFINYIRDYDKGVETMPDISKPSEWAVDSWKWAKDEKIIQGYEDNTDRPLDVATREEMAVMLHRLYKKLK